MRHFLFPGLLGVAMTLDVSSSIVQGQDKIERRDRKTDKTVTVTGKILEESLAGLKLRVPGGKEELIPGSDVLRIFYDDLGALKIAFDRIFNNEEKEKDLAKLLKDYNDFKAKAANADLKPPIKRYLDFRIAQVQAAGAETDRSKEEARVALNTFVSTYPGTWEYAQAVQMLARMLAEVGDYEGAAKALDGLVRNPGAPPDVKQESEAMLVDAMFQSKKSDQAKAKISAGLKDPDLPEQQKARYRIYQIGIAAQAPDAKLDDEIKKLDEAIAKTNDNTLKALAYNIMGDCYAQNSRKRDAMWSYLWVDVVYPQDKNERLKAMTKLVKIFQDDDTEKADMYKEKIKRLK
jgi:tetratricopeptide (TPR) repeat protein